MFLSTPQLKFRRLTNPQCSCTRSSVHEQNLVKKSSRNLDFSKKCDKIEIKRRKRNLKFKRLLSFIGLAVLSISMFSVNSVSADSHSNQTYLSGEAKTVKMKT